MAGKRDKPEEIVAKLRQVEVLQGQGQLIADAARQIGVTHQTYYRWRKCPASDPNLPPSISDNVLYHILSVW